MEKNVRINYETEWNDNYKVMETQVTVNNYEKIKFSIIWLKNKAPYYSWQWYNDITAMQNKSYICHNPHN